jgi:hypothetical protein
MTPREVAGLICAGAVPLAGLAVWGLYRLSRWFERKGGAGARASGGGAGLLFELDKLTRPSIEHVIATQDVRQESAEHGGE